MNKKIVVSVLLSTALLTGLVANTYASNTQTGSTNIKKEVRHQVKKVKTGSGVMNNMGKMDKNMMFGEKMGKHFKAMNKLTDAEKESLKTMTLEQKKAFFEKKRAEMEAKRESHEAVIDKLINGVALTDAEKIILEDIKKERAEKKAKKAEMKAKMDEIKAILEKKKNGTTLTADEKAKLTEFQSMHKKDGKGKGKGMGFGKMWK